MNARVTVPQAPGQRERTGDEFTTSPSGDPTVYRRRWAILAVLCLGLMIVGIDGTIVNVALPSLVRELGASSSQLQWVVDAYTLVFASFLLIAGNTGDRHGRRMALVVGLVVFGAGSLASAMSGSAGILIGTRAVQGFGAAFIMPSTLSILTNVFPAEERARAIGIWAGVSGLGVAIGPITGGYLLNHFWWGSIFLVNVPVILVALAATAVLVPNSKDPDAPPLDFLGAVLSVLSLLALLYAIIEGPSRGWTEPLVIGGFIAGAVLLTAFALWELHTPNPMLDVTFFKNPRFSAASIAVTLVFFAMFGTLFFLSQYLQFVLGYSPLDAGIRFLPVAAVLVVAAPLSSLLVRWFGTKAVVTAGLVLVAAGMLIMSTVTVTSGYGLVAIVLIVIGAGMAIAMAPATDSIMGSLPPEHAGVGSAVNDTTREVGGALGVAVLGSITAGVYRSQITREPIYKLVAAQSPAGASAIRDSVGAAAEVAHRVPAAAARLLGEATDRAFVHALDRTVLVGAAIALLGALVALVWLPSRPVVEESEYEDMHDLVVRTAQRLPRTARARRDVSGATLQLLSEAGFSSLTYHGVASRSGISTGTIERYWRTKLDLVVDALDDLLTPVPPHDTGTFRGDCEGYLGTLAVALASPRAAPILGNLIGEAAANPQLAEQFRQRLVQPRRDALVVMIDRAVARGELPSDVDRGVLADVLIGPLLHRTIITGEAVDQTVAGHVVELALSGAERPDSG